MQNIFFKFILLFISVFFISCSTKQSEKITIIIPGAPEEPRIFFDTVYRGDVDFVKRNSVDMFIGEFIEIGKNNLSKPYGITANNGIIYVTDTAKGVVFAINEKLKKVSLVGDKSVGKLALPIGVAVDSSGKLYVADAKQARVSVYNENADLVMAFGKQGEFYKPTDIAINRLENILYIVDTNDHNIKVYSLDGKKLFSFGKRGKEEGEFNFPTNIAVDQRNGNVVVVDTQNFRVQIFDKEGKFIRKFGEVGDKAGMFARPKGVGIDSDGNIYVADAAFSNVQVFNDSGELLIFFGSTGKNIGAFSLISGMYIDENDRIYIVDGFNKRVQVYQYVSEKWKEKNPLKYEKLKEI